MNGRYATVDEYLADVADGTRRVLTELRERIKSKAPEAVESISYGMPTYKYKGRPLIYFAAWKEHWALYGTAQGTLRFAPDETPSEEQLSSLLSGRMSEIEAAQGK